MKRGPSRAAVAVGAALLCGPAWPAQTGAAPGLPQRSAAQQAELKELRARIEALQKKLAAAEEVQSEAVDALRASERAISVANRRLFEIGERQQQVASELERLGVEGAEIAAAVKARQAQLGRLLHRWYVAGEPDALRLALAGDSVADAYRLLTYYGYIARAIDADVRRALREAQRRLAETTDATRERRVELDRLQSEATAERQRLEAERRERQAVLARVSRDIEDRRRAIDTLRRDEQRLTRLVEQLGRLLAARSKPPPRVPGAPSEARVRGTEGAGPAAGAAERPALPVERVPQPDAAAGSFASRRGQLALPVAGQVTNRFGAPRADGGLHWRGLQIAARAGDLVRAVAPGRVVFADWLRGFGNLLIVDHGDGYMSLYGNNESLVRRVGDPVRGGDTLATVGSSGGSGEPGVYFELRHQGKPFDPLAWVRLR